MAPAPAPPAGVVEGPPGAPEGEPATRRPAGEREPWGTGLSETHAYITLVSVSRP
jgi:hypothetical protein